MAKDTEKKEETAQFWAELGVPLVTLNAAREIIELCFASKTIPCLVGHAGIGKTQIFQQIARDHGMGYLALYTQLSMPEDISGLPFQSPDGKSYDLLIDKRLKEAVEANDKGILVFEEVNRANRETSCAVFAFMDNRGSGTFKLPEGWKIAIAQNPSGGEYAVNDLNSDHAFRRRVTWMAVREDTRVWLDYARNAGFEDSVLDYIQTNPRMLLDSAARSSGKAYANPAAWEKVSFTIASLKAMGKEIIPNLDLLRNKISGDIGEAAADNFCEFVRDSSRSLSPAEVLADYSSEKKRVRQRVQAALKDNQVDRVTILLQGVVRELLGTKPPATKELAKNIGMLCSDLPKELMGTLMSEFASSRNSPEDEKYIANVQQRLSLDRDYAMAIRGLTTTLDKVDDEVAAAGASKK